MKKIQFPIKTILWFLLIWVNSTFAQMKQKDSYMVYINYPDYTVKTTVSNSTKRIHVKESLTYYWYASNKILQTKGDYDGKIVDGPYTSFYLSNSLKEKGNFKKGLKDGKWISWFENGKINEITNWKRGAKCGEYKKFDSNELLSVTAYYKNDRLNGTQTTYINGEIDNKTKYKHGKEIIKKQKHDSNTDSLAQGNSTVQQRRSWKEKIAAPFQKKKKKAATVTDKTPPAVQKKTLKEKLNSFFKKENKKPAATAVEATINETQSPAPSEIEPSQKRKAKKINKPQEVNK